METINLTKKNALGRVFWTLPKEIREQIFKENARIRQIYRQNNTEKQPHHRDCLRQYFFLNTKSNPEKLDSELKKYMVTVSAKFDGCFVPNHLNDIALERLASAA